jgi:hypothetical protein
MTIVGTPKIRAKGMWCWFAKLSCGVIFGASRYKNSVCTGVGGSGKEMKVEV